MSLPTRGRDMLVSLQRSEFLPPWDEEGVRVVTTEMSDAFENLSAIAEEHGSRIDSISTKINVVYHNTCLQRNKRYLSRQ